MTTPIVICGCDNTGKTTLLNSLAQHFKLPQARTNTYPRTREEILAWHHWAETCPTPLILDRHPAISDLVYGPTIRGDTSSNPGLASSLRQRMYLIICLPPLQVVQNSFSGREQMKGTHENLYSLYSAYEGLSTFLDPDYIYNYTAKGSYDRLIAHLTTALPRLSHHG